MGPISVNEALPRHDNKPNPAGSKVVPVVAFTRPATVWPILVFRVIYAKGYVGKGNPLAGARLGFLFGIFLAGAFVAVKLRDHPHRRQARAGRGVASFPAIGSSPKHVKLIPGAFTGPAGTKRQLIWIA